MSGGGNLQKTGVEVVSEVSFEAWGQWLDWKLLDVAAALTSFWETIPHSVSLDC